MDVQNIRLIIFDVDGTLAETDDYFVEKTANALRKVFRFVKQEPMEKFIRPAVMFGETVLHGFYRLLDILGLDPVLSKLHSSFSVKYEYKYREISGMRKTVSILSEHYPLAIISSGGRQSTRAFLEKYGLESKIRFVISAEDCRYIKPHPAPILMIAEEAGFPPQNCLMVGDTIFDILCAKRAGAASVAVLTGFDTKRFLQWHKPDLILDSVTDLPGVLGLV